MFVDASAIVAILTEEDDGRALAAELENAAAPVTSPIALWESAASISRKMRSTAQQELGLVDAFISAAGIVIEPITAELAREALIAFDRYGRRSGHPADLNLGDCFAYACARRLGARLLHTGKDFTLTDINKHAPQA
jgi:ribonuclease VapC